MRNSGRMRRSRPRPARLPTSPGGMSPMDNPLPPTTPFDVVALVASAGGLGAFSHVLSGLPAQFPAAVIVLQHLEPSHPSLLAHLLSRCTGLPVKQAKDGDRLGPGMVFVAPPNRHLVVDGDGILS